MKHRDAQSVLDKLAKDARAAGYPIVRASIRMLTDDGAALRIAAVWGHASDLIRVGSLLGIGATSFPEVVRTNGPVSSDEVAETLAGEVLRDEGVRSWIASPLRDSVGLPVGLLTFSSDRPNAFSKDSHRFFGSVAQGFETEILRLLAGSGSR